MERQLWHDREVRTLLTIIKDQHSFKLLDKQIKRNEFIYREIEQDMRAKGYRKSAMQIRVKFRQMKQGFLAIVRQNDLAKADSHTLDNLDLLKEIFKYHPSMLLDRRLQDESTNNRTVPPLDHRKSSEQSTSKNNDETPQVFQELIRLEARDPLTCGEQELEIETEISAAELLKPTTHTETLLRNAVRVEASNDTTDESASMEDNPEPKPKHRTRIQSHSTCNPAKLSSPLITRAIAGMIVKDLQPFGMTEQDGFRDLINFLAPEYLIPSPNTFSRTIIPKLYQEERAKLRGFLKEQMELGIESAAFTIDGWISRATDEYLSLTMHFLSKSMQLERLVLDVRKLPDVQGAQNVSDFIHAALNEWGLSTLPSPIYFVTANSSNLVRAIRLNSDSWSHIPCFGHTLQLIVNDSLKGNAELQNVFEKARRIVAYLTRSPKAATALEKAQQSVEPLKQCPLPQQDVPALWNSQYDMLYGLIELRAVLEEASKKEGEVTSLTENEWEIATQFQKLFQPLKAATTLMKEEKYPAASYYIPVMKTLQKMCSEFECEASESIKNVCSTLFGELSKKVENLECCDKPLLLAMVLDPRFKLKFVTSDQRQEVRALLELECANRVENNSYVCHEDICTSSNIDPSVLNKFYSILFGKNAASRTAADIKIQAEISMYFNQSRCGRQTDVLQWWRDHMPIYPNLYRLAKSFLNIPATQCSSERLFSPCEHKDRAERASLLTEHLEEIAFLHENI